MLARADTWWLVLARAGSCWRVLAYVDRVLYYAGVMCGPGAGADLTDANVALLLDEVMSQATFEGGVTGGRGLLQQLKSLVRPCHVFQGRKSAHHFGPSLGGCWVYF